jgi:hypothetical protein
MFSLKISGADQTGILKSHSLRIKRAAEGRNECSFTLISPYASYNPAIGAEVVARLDGTIVFGGVIKERRIGRLNKNGIVYSSIQVACQGYNHIPKRRTIQYRPDNVSAGHAVRYMLENVLKAEGITGGMIEDGIALFGYDAELKSVRDVLDDLAESSGFKWYIDDEKRLFFLRSDTIPDAPFQLIEEGGQFTDFSNVEVTDTLEGYRNKQFVRAGDRIIVMQNDSEIAARSAVEGGTGVYGEVEKNDCYTAGRKITPKGIMVHSTATPGVMAAAWFSRWNKSYKAGETNRQVCVHAFLDDKEIWQYLPWDHRGWHAGGSANDTHIGFEICEPSGFKYVNNVMTGYNVASQEAYFRKVWKNAVELCVYLCKLYGLNETNIICHSEGYKEGIASNHADVMHWFVRPDRAMLIAA